MNYYKLKFSSCWRDESDGHVCTVDITKVKHLGRKSKSEAVDVSRAAIYAYCVTMGDTKGAVRPRYLISDKESVNAVIDDFNSSSGHILTALINLSEEIVNNT